MMKIFLVGRPSGQIIPNLFQWKYFAAISGCLLFLLLPNLRSSQERDDAQPLLGKLETYAEAQFDSVMMFGLIGAYINNTTGGESECLMRSGMDREEVERMMMEQFNNNFTGIPYQEMADEALASLMESSDPQRAAVGFIIAHIDIQPVNIDLEGIGDYFVYQITLQSGNLAAYIIWENSMATVCSKRYIKARVQSDLRHLMDKLAIDFFKSRGEL